MTPDRNRAPGDGRITMTNENVAAIMKKVLVCSHDAYGLGNILRPYDASAGSVTIDGIDVRRFQRESLWILELRDGEIVEQGTHATLSAQGGYHCELFRVDDAQVAA